MAAADEAGPGQEEVWPAVADGGGQLDDQAAAGLGAAGAELWSQCREIILRVITHNVMIVARIEVFYRARRP